MAEATAQTGFNQHTFDAFIESRGEPDWVTDLRRSAWDLFTQMDFPKRNEEEWMRTDLRLFNLDRFVAAVARDEDREPEDRDSEGWDPEDREPAVGVLTEGVELAGRTVASDSHCIHAELDDFWKKQGVVFDSLDRAVQHHGDLVRPYLLTRAMDVGYDKFAALHGAMFAGGTFLYVPPGVKIDKPLHVLSGLTDGGVDLGHLLLVLDRGAEATVLTETLSRNENATGLHCGGIEVLLGPEARLRYVNLQNWSSGVWHFAHQKALLGEGASLQWTIGALGARLAKVNQHVVLEGEHAKAQVNGVMFAEGKQHLAYHTLQHHKAADCFSDLLYKGAIQDRANLVWRGMIKVDPGAQKTDAYQRNDNLILTDSARADSIPGLEIEADDVRCSHGATSGRVDESEIFYARTRGLTRKEAIRMIVAGFFQQVFDRISIESVRESLGQAIGRKIREYY